MFQPVPTVLLCTGSAVQVAGSNTPDGIAHSGNVLFSAVAAGSGTWSIAFSFAAHLGNGNYDASDIKTLTVANTDVGGVKTLAVATGAKRTSGAGFRPSLVRLPGLCSWKVHRSMGRTETNHPHI